MANYICHHGIMGQKWGIRRYQNPDGTLTEAGKKRYGGNVEAVKRKDIRKQFIDAGKSGIRNRSTEVGRKALTEAEENWKNSKEYKAYKEALDLYREFGAPQVNNDILIPVDDAERLNYLKLRSNVVYGYEFTRAIDTYTESLLKDLGYEDSEKGREYVWNTLMDDPKTSEVLTSELNNR